MLEKIALDTGKHTMFQVIKLLGILRALRSKIRHQIIKATDDLAHRESDPKDNNNNNINNKVGRGLGGHLV